MERQLFSISRLFFLQWRKLISATANWPRNGAINGGHQTVISLATLASECTFFFLFQSKSLINGNCYFILLGSMESQRANSMAAFFVFFSSFPSLISPFIFCFHFTHSPPRSLPRWPINERFCFNCRCLLAVAVAGRFHHGLHLSLGSFFIYIFFFTEFYLVLLDFTWFTGFLLGFIWFTGLLLGLHSFI